MLSSRAVGRGRGSWELVAEGEAAAEADTEAEPEGDGEAEALQESEAEADTEPEVEGEPEEEGEAEEEGEPDSVRLRPCCSRASASRASRARLEGGRRGELRGRTVRRRCEERIMNGKSSLRTGRPRLGHPDSGSPPIVNLSLTHPCSAAQLCAQLLALFASPSPACHPQAQGPSPFALCLPSSRQR